MPRPLTFLLALLPLLLVSSAAKTRRAREGAGER